MKTTLSVPARVLLFAMAVAVAIPLLLWLIVRGGEWLCGARLACGGG